MVEIWTMGELLVEIMRPRPGMQLCEPGEFLGPFPSGAPAIFADAVARLGHSSGIIGGVGDDDFGRCILGRLERDGVCTEYVRRVPNKSTAVAFVTYFRDGSRKFIFHIDNTPAVMADTAGLEKISSPRFFHVMGCSLMTSEAFRSRVFEAAELFRAKGARITFDPNIRVELLGDRGLNEVIGPIMATCSILLPGEKELALLTGEDEPDMGVKRLFDSYPMEVIVLKRGKRGCSIYTRDAVFHIPAYQVDEMDPTGAGDCFDAGFLCGILDGRSLEECGQIAAAAGALNAAAFGPMEGNIARETIENLMSGQDLR